jgi:hypothetical protein
MYLKFVETNLWKIVNIGCVNNQFFLFLQGGIDFMCWWCQKPCFSNDMTFKTSSPCVENWFMYNVYSHEINNDYVH